MTAYSTAVAYLHRTRYSGVVPPPSRTYTSPSAYRNAMPYTGLDFVFGADSGTVTDAAVLSATIALVDAGSGVDAHGIGVVALAGEAMVAVEGMASIAQLVADVFGVVTETAAQGTALYSSDTARGADGGANYLQDGVYTSSSWYTPPGEWANISQTLSDVAVMVDGTPVLTATLNVSDLVSALEAAGIAVTSTDVGAGTDSNPGIALAADDTAAGLDDDIGGDRFTVVADVATVYIAVMGPYGSLARKLDFLAVDRYRAKPYRGRRMR
jgi:hypothetical protein